MDKMVMVGAETDEVVGGGFSAVLPELDVVDFANCVSAPGESASAMVSDGDCFAHWQRDDSFKGRNCVEVSAWVE
jgi:hypothetical protein